jgi:hypothetical protein
MEASPMPLKIFGIDARAGEILPALVFALESDARTGGREFRG